MISAEFKLNKNIIREDIKNGIRPSSFIMDMMSKDDAVLTRTFDDFEKLITKTITELLVTDNIRNITAYFEYKGIIFDCCIVNTGEIQVTLYDKLNMSHKLYRGMATKDLDLDELIKDNIAL